DVTARGGGTLALAVSSPVDLSFAAARTLEERFGLPGLQGTLLGNDLPFGLLTAFVDGAEDATGSLSATGSVRGTLLDPHPEFDVSMPTGSVCMAPLDVCYEDIELAAHSTLENLELENFEMISRTARIAEDPGGRRNKKGVEKTTGSVHAEGSFALDPDNRGDAVLDVNAKDFWVSDTHRLRLRTDARVSVRGRYPDLRVRGDVEVRELKVEMGDELRRSAFSLERDPRLVVHRGREDVEEEEVESEERIRLTDHLDLRVHVSLDTNCWLFLDVSTLPGLGRIRPDLQLTGDLELAIQQGEMFGDGDVRALRGNLTVLGKQFKVDEGVVTFTGSSPPDPILDVSAIHRSRYGDITITVTGRSRTPTLSFTSDEYDDEADILSILLFGAPMDELRPGSSTDQGDELGILAAMGFAQANQAMAKLFGHSAVDMINLETNPAGPGSYGIEVGKSITDRVFLITRYRFGGVEEDQNVFEAQLEIQITRSLYIEMRYGDAGNGGIEVFWKRKLHNPPSRTKVKTDDG
ncbi:MAG: translocation/assembly module TamB domain-containing protein, partial [Myxococcota bacterium]|nr:translocation/assembly module TamB domain-containing protein [Myxococcota bacterium]